MPNGQWSAFLLSLMLHCISWQVDRFGEFVMAFAEAGGSFRHFGEWSLEVPTQVSELSRTRVNVLEVGQNLPRGLSRVQVAKKW
jgi:hypothetical protein